MPVRPAVALVVLALLGAPALPPTAAAAATSPGAVVVPGVQAAVRGVVDAPSARTAADLAAALRRAARGGTGVVAASPSGPPGAEPPPDPVRLGSAGDVDGDRRDDVVEQREGRTLVRSGRTGRALLRLPGEDLLPVAGSGRVRLVALSTSFSESADGFTLTLRLRGLDAAGRARWTATSTGSVRQLGGEQASGVLLDRLPAQLRPHVDPQGRPVLLLGELSGALSGAGAASRLSVRTVRLADGGATALPDVLGAGQGLPGVSPLGAALGRRGCHLAVQPLGAAATAALQCGPGAPVWTRAVDLVDASAELAGDFDGDRRADLALTTFGFEPAGPGDVGRGTRVLSGATGAQVGTSSLDTLLPLGLDVGGDRQPDFVRPLFERGFGVQGLTLAGRQLYRRNVELTGSGGLALQLGTDVTGDAVPDAFLTAEPQQGEGTAVVVDGRSGRAVVVPGGDGLLLPGLRGRGGDVVVRDVVAGRARVTVHDGGSGRRLTRVVVPGPTGAAAHGSVAALDADGDRRPDLVSATRTDRQRRLTASTRAGRLLWQQREQGPVVRDPGSGGVVVE